MDSIEALIDRARAPDASLAMRQATFSLIVERYQDAAYGYALATLGDPHLAWDAAQEAFLTAYCSLAELRSPEAFPGWLRRIVRTRCRLLRREHPLAMASLDALDQIGTDGHSSRGQRSADNWRRLPSFCVRAPRSTPRIGVARRRWGGRSAPSAGRWPPYLV